MFGKLSGLAKNVGQTAANAAAKAAEAAAAAKDDAVDRYHRALGTYNYIWQEVLCDGVISVSPDQVRWWEAVVSKDRAPLDQTLRFCEIVVTKSSQPKSQPTGEEEEEEEEDPVRIVHFCVWESKDAAMEARARAQGRLAHTSTPDQQQALVGKLHASYASGADHRIKLKVPSDSFWEKDIDIGEEEYALGFQLSSSKRPFDRVHTFAVGGSMFKDKLPEERSRWLAALRDAGLTSKPKDESADDKWRIHHKEVLLDGHMVVGDLERSATSLLAAPISDSRGRSQRVRQPSKAGSGAEEKEEAPRKMKCYFRLVKWNPNVPPTPPARGGQDTTTSRLNDLLTEIKPLALLQWWRSKGHMSAMPTRPRGEWILTGSWDEYVRVADLPAAKTEWTEEDIAAAASESGSSDRGSRRFLHVRARAPLTSLASYLRQKKVSLWRSGGSSASIKDREEFEALQELQHRHELRKDFFSRVTLLLECWNDDASEQWARTLHSVGVHNVPLHLDEQMKRFLSGQELQSYPPPPRERRNLGLTAASSVAVGAASMFGGAALKTAAGAIKAAAKAKSFAALLGAAVDEELQSALLWLMDHLDNKQGLAKSLARKFRYEYDNPGEADWRYEEVFRQGATPAGIAELHLFQFFLFAAKISYKGETEPGYISRQAKARGFTLISPSVESHPHEPSFCVMAQTKKKLVVVSIRGTDSTSDVMTDLQTEPLVVDWKDGPKGAPTSFHCHRGFLLAGRWLQRILQGHLEQLVKQGYRIVFTGHSYGAACAIVLGLLLRPILPELRVFAFCPPACVDTSLAEWVLQDDPNFIQCLVNGHDIVPRMSIHNAIRMDQELRAEELARAKEAGDQKAIAELEAETPTSEKKDPGEELVVPGRIVFLEAFQSVERSTIVNYKSPVMRTISFSTSATDCHLIDNVHVALCDVIEAHDMKDYQLNLDQHKAR